GPGTERRRLGLGRPRAGGALGAGGRSLPSPLLRDCHRQDIRASEREAWSWSAGIVPAPIRAGATLPPAPPNPSASLRAGSWERRAYVQGTGKTPALLVSTFSGVVGEGRIAAPARGLIAGQGGGRCGALPRGSAPAPRSPRARAWSGPHRRGRPR